MKIDRSNTDPKYWDEILAKKKLSVIAPEDEEFETPEAIPELIRKPSRNKDYERLMTVIDGDDLFLFGGRGHQIQKIRVLDRETPSWAMDNEAIRKMIDTVFPKWRKNSVQRKRAARWVGVIYLFYRVRLSRVLVAAEMRLPVETVKNILNRIRRTMQGTRSSNAGKRIR